MLVRPYPTVQDPETMARMAEGRRRYSMMIGRWAGELREEFVRWFPLERTRRQIGRPDTTKNAARTVVSQLATLYDVTPIVQHPDSVGATEIMRGLTDEAGLWELMRLHQQYVIAQREGAIRVWVDDGYVRYRQVPGHLLNAWARPDDPDAPVIIHEYRPREIKRTGGDVETIWTRDVWDISDLEAPRYAIEDEEGRDITALVAGDPAISGDEYPYRDDDGRPVLPFAFYHAARTGRLWDSFYGAELFTGSLMVAVLWTFWAHIVRDASWPQRYGVNVDVNGVSMDEEHAGGGPFVDLDPASMLALRSRPGVTHEVGQWAPGGDPKVLGDAIRAYAADLAIEFDVSPADVQRSHSDARSGYAIEITRDGQRHAQRRYKPGFARGDRQLLRATAIVARAHKVPGASALPSDGWRVHYPGLPLSLEERRVRMEEYAARAELGIASPVQLLAEIDGLTEDEARAQLDKIQDDIARYSRQSPAPSRRPDQSPQEMTDGRRDPARDTGDHADAAAAV